MVNEAIIQGRLTKDPELKHTQSDIPFLTFTVAWSEKYKEVETKCFMLCKAWRGTAEMISKYFGKGKEIVVQGRLVTEKWGDNEVTFLEVNKTHFCGPKGQEQRQQTPPPAPPDDFIDVPDDVQEKLPFE